MMKRKSGSLGKRRSSILKIDNDFNRNDDTTGMLFNKSRVQSRRVSFAETTQVKEFARDSPRVWNWDTTEEDHNKENELKRTTTGGVSVTGLESLLNGTIETESYKNTIECPIPEMSADSFHLLDQGNKTVLEQLDMETTQCMEPTEDPFRTEPSREIRFDAFSFLNSLKGKSSSLEPMQIYGPPKSPQRSFHQVSCTQDDQENFPVMMDDHMVESKVKYDAQAFLGNLFGSKGLGGSKTLNGKDADEHEEMEETCCLDYDISSQIQTENEEKEMPAINSNIGNVTILGNATGVEETACIGGILTKTDGWSNSKMSTGISMNTTTNNDEMEETNCIGMLLNTSRVNMNNNPGLKNSLFNSTVDKSCNVSVNKTVLGDDVNGFEETTCIGSILSILDKENMHTIDKENICTIGKENISTIDKENICTIGKENISTIGKENICTIDKENISTIDKENIVPRELSWISSEDKTRYFGESEPVESMEETCCVGTIIKKDFKTPTRIGGLKMCGDKTTHFTDQEDFMDETKVVGGNEVLQFPKPVQVKNIDSDQSVYFTESEQLSGIKKPTVVVESVINIPLHQTEAIESQLHQTNTSLNFTHIDNKTFVMEETTCVGQLMQQPFLAENKVGQTQKVDKTNYLNDIEHTSSLEENVYIEVITDGEKLDRQTKLQNVSALSKTIYFDQQQTGIEETKCIGGIFDDSINALTNVETLELGLQQECESNSENNKKSEKQVNENRHEELTVTCVDDIESKIDDDTDTQQVCPNITNTEITSKTTAPEVNSSLQTINKSILPEFDSYKPEIDKTRDFTQTDTTLKKIKELLMASAQKSAPKIRAGIIKTPSKSTQLVNNASMLSSSKLTIAPSPTASPAHKRIRLFETAADVPTDRTDDLGVRPLSLVQGVQKLACNIDDETMPDSMEDITDLLSNIDGTDVAHTVTELQNSTAQCSNESRTISCSDSSISNLSALSNRSFVAKPQVIPEGPLSLDTFFRLTVKPLAFMKKSRFSLISDPSIDLDCTEEVLDSELVDGPFVETKKVLHKKINDLKLENEEKYARLQQTLEEIQPQVFQDVSNSNTEEVKELREKLYSLFGCCSKEANSIWKQETRKMYEETMDLINDDSLTRVKAIQEDLRAQNDEIDHLLSTLDNDFKELEESELLLDELEEKKNRLECECNAVNAEMEKNLKIQLDLKMKDDEKTRTALKHKILQQLMLTEWDLEEFEADKICFTFLDDEFALTVHLKPGLNEPLIKDIVFQTRQKPGYQWVHKKMTLSLLCEALDKDYILHNCTEFSSLPKILREISSIANELKQLAMDVGEIDSKHKLSWDNRTLSFELWNTDTVKMVKLFLKFTPKLPQTSSITSSVQISVKHQIGDLSDTDIQQRLNHVETGPHYLQRVVKAVTQLLN